MTTINFNRYHFPAYDLNGNVMGMVNATMAEWQIEGKGCCKR